MSRKPSSEWVNTKTAAELLSCSPDHLLNLRTDGVLKAGKHWRDIRRRNAARATYRWHVEHCGEALGIAPEKRS